MEFFKTLFKSFPGIIYRCAPDDEWTMEYISEGCLELTGYPPEHFIGNRYLSFASLIVEDDRHGITDQMRQAAYEGQTFTLEYRIRNKDGRILTVMERGQGILDDKGELMALEGFIWDISERRRMEEALRESEERFRSIFENVNIGLYRSTPGGRIIMANPAMAKMLDFPSVEELLKYNFEEVAVKAAYDRAYFRRLIEKKGEVRDLETTWRKKDGTQLYFKENARAIRGPGGKVLYYEGWVEEITERKKAEQRQQAEVDILASLTETENLQQAVSTALERILSVTGLKAGAIRLPRDGVYPCVASAGFPAPPGKEKPDFCILEGESVFLPGEKGQLAQDCLCARVIHGRLPDSWEGVNEYGSLYIPDTGKWIQSDSKSRELKRRRAWYARCNSAGFQTLAIIPFKAGHEIVGLILLADPRTDALARDDLIFVQNIAQHIGYVFKHLQDRENLRQSEEKYREILSTIEEGYYEVDLNGTVKFINEAACRILGYSREEMLEADYRKFYRDPEAVYAVFHQVFLTGRPERGFTMEMVRKDGSTLFGELSVSLIKDSAGRITGFRGVGRDITDRVRFEKKLRYLSLHDQLTGLYNRTYFEEELSRLKNSRNFPVSIICVDLDGLKLVNDTLGHKKGDQLLKNCARVLKKALRKGDLLARIGGDEFVALLPFTGVAEAEKICQRIRSLVEKFNTQHPRLPLSISLGLATAENPERSLDIALRQADNYMYRDKLYRSAGARSQIINALMATLAERDYITQGHTARLQEYSRALGQRMKLTTRQLTDLALLAQVHDLGKVGIPDHILFKKGPLTDEEWEIMKQHPEKGFRIARSSNDLAPIADLILRHHERWDGQGYPLGIAGEDIPVECRILAIVDAFDAMTHDRPYKPACSKEEALAELRRCAGTQFDPQLVEEFIRVLEELS